MQSIDLDSGVVRENQIKRLSNVACTLFVLVFISSALALLAWYLGWPLFVDPFGLGIPISPLTSVHLLLLSGGCIAWRWLRMPRIFFVSILILLLASSIYVFLDKSFGFSFHLDQILLLNRFNQFPSTSLGMAPTTVVALLVVIVVFGLVINPLASHTLREIVSLVIFFSSIVVLLVYFFRTPEQNAFFLMAPVTALNLAVLSIAIPLSNLQKGFLRKFFIGTFGRSPLGYLIVVAFLLPVCFAYFILSNDWRHAELGITSIIVVFLSALTATLWGVARALNDRGTVAEENQKMAEDLAAANEELQASTEELQATNEELQATNEELSSNIEALSRSNTALEIANQTIIRQKDEMLNRVIDSTNDVIWSYDLTGKNENYLSRSAEKIYKVPYETLINKPYFWLEYVLPEDKPIKMESQARLNVTGKTTCTYRIVINNEVRWVRDQLKLFRDENGTPLRVEGVATDITEVKKAENELKEYRQNLEIIFQNSTDFFALLNAHAEIVFLNKSLQEYIRTYTKAEPKPGTSFYDIVAHNRKEIVQKLIQRVLKGERINTVSESIFENEIKYYNVIYSPVKKDGVVTLITITSTDITEQKKQEIVIEKYRQNLEIIFNHSADNFVLLDREAKIVLLNENFKRFTKGTVGTNPIAGMSIYEVLPSNRVEPSREIIQKAFLGTASEVVATAMFNEGQRHFSVRYNPVIYDGAVQFISISAFDVTEKKNQEILLHQSEEFSRELLDSMNLHIAVIGSQGEIIATNQAWNNFGRLNGESSLNQISIGSNYFTVCKKAITGGDEIAQHALLGIQAVLTKEKEEFEMEYPCDSPEEKRWFQLRVMPFQKDRAITLHYDITQRKQIEDELKQDQYFLNKASELAKIGYWTAQPDIINGKITWSQELLNIFELDANEFLGKANQLLEFMFPGDIPALEENFRGALEHNKPFDFDHRIKLRSGKIKWVNSNAHLIRDQQGNPTMFVGVTQDITLRKEIEEKLRQDQYFLDKASESAKVGYWTSEPDNENGKLTWSKEVFKIFGIREEDFKGTNHFFFSRVHPDDRYRVAELSRQALEQNKNYDVDHRILLPDGNVRWINEKGQALHDKKGKATLMVGIVQDINDRKIIEQVLREYNERFEVLSKATNDAIWDLDIEKDTETWNHGLKSIFGYDQREVKDAKQWWAEKVHPDDHARVISEMNSMIEKQSANWTSEYRYLCADGSYKNVLDRAYIIYSGKKAVRMIGAMQDISEVARYRENLEEIIEQRTAELNESLAKEKDLIEMKSKFISIASHEFRTPLATISLSANYLNRYSKKLKAKQIKEKAETIGLQVLHMKAMLEDVLFVGKSDEGKIKVELNETPITIFEELVTEALHSRGNTHRLELSVNAKAKSFTSDEKLLRNIVFNLVSNAVKFSPQADKVYLTVHEVQKHLVVTVRDAGIGIPENEVKNLFSSFTRASNASHIEGTGLGLLIIQRAVELLDGKIEVKSKVGKGSEFIVTLPLK